MLAPLNRVEVNSLLDKLPERAELSEETDAVPDRLQDVVNFTFSGETANAETNTAVGALVTATEGPQNVAGLKRCRGTGTTRRKSDILQGHQERLALDVCKGNVDAAGIVTRGVTVQGGVLHGEETILEFVGERGDAFGVILLPKSAIVLKRRTERTI